MSNYSFSGSGTKLNSSGSPVVQGKIVQGYNTPPIPPPPVNTAPGFIPPVYVSIGRVLIFPQDNTQTTNSVELVRCGDCGAVIEQFAWWGIHVNWHQRMFMAADTLQLLRTGITKMEET